jgi:serine-type D-Ala-D-Ala carboxypeptidase
MLPARVMYARSARVWASATCAERTINGASSPSESLWRYAFRVTELRDGTAAEAGLSARHLDHVRDLAAGWVKDGIHPALAVCVARRGVVALHEAFGRLGPEPDAPALARDALWPLASLVKPITATALMTLVEDGRVGLTRAVREYVPEFAGGDKDGVCVHHLLTHTSGIEGPILGTDEFATAFTAPTEGPARDASLHPVVERLLGIAYERPLRGAPGVEMFYDGLNYELLGEIIRRVGGRPVGAFVQDRIFRPLGMADSHWTVPDDLVGRLVRVRAEGPVTFAWEVPFAEIPAASMGACSTVRDMAVFGQAFLDRSTDTAARLLAPPTIDAMVTNQIPGVPGVLTVMERHDEASWGYGWGIASHEKWNFFPTPPPATFAHAGATGTYLWCDPAHELVGVFFAPMSSTDIYGMPRWQADLFVTAVTTAIED